MTLVTDTNYFVHKDPNSLGDNYATIVTSCIDNTFKSPGGILSFGGAVLLLMFLRTSFAFSTFG